MSLADDQNARPVPVPRTRRDKERVYGEWQACLQELDRAIAKERSACPPPTEPLEAGKPVPVLSEECLEAQDKRRDIQEREHELSEEYQRLILAGE